MFEGDKRKSWNKNKGTQQSWCLPPHLTMKTDPVSETLCFLVFRTPEDGQRPKSQ
jgi:hypothetical protein